MVTFAAMLVAVGVLALPIVRRRHFEVFYYSHHIALAFFVTSLWHATGSQPFYWAACSGSSTAFSACSARHRCRPRF